MRNPWGPRAGKTLTEKQKEKAVKMRKAGQPWSDIRAWFGCSQSTLSRVWDEAKEREGQCQAQ